jgi:hypothetical protein
MTTFFFYRKEKTLPHTKEKQNTVYDSGMEKQFKTKLNRKLTRKNYTFERVENPKN